MLLRAQLWDPDPMGYGEQQGITRRGHHLSTQSGLQRGGRRDELSWGGLRQGCGAALGSLVG